MCRHLLVFVAWVPLVLAARERPLTAADHAPVPPAVAAPYPPSPVIARLTFDWSTHQRHAQGSDNWQLTWADDDHQYGAWGDGGGIRGRRQERGARWARLRPHRRRLARLPRV